MKITAILALGSLLVSCGNSQLVSHLEGSDSVAVSFTQQGSGALIKIVGTSGHYAILDLINYSDGKETTQSNCADDGHIVFFKKGIPAGYVSFNYTTAGCQHFKLNKDGKITATEMNNQAIDFLKQLRSDQ